MNDEIRWDEHGPSDALEIELYPAAQRALQRGIVEYKALWVEHFREDFTPLENARHTIEVHAQTRIAEALERLDYGDIAGFVDKLGSAVGYLANAICKVRYQDGTKSKI